MEKIIITTPTSVSAATYVYIQKKAIEMFGSDNIEHAYDDSLIGGFTIAAGGKFYDNSLKTRFEQLRKFMSE